MGRKLTYQEVKDAFEKRGYKLLEREYKGKDIPMRYECPHHSDKEIRICYNSLRNGNGCRFCSKEKVSKKLRLDYEKVEEEFNNAGYMLLGNFYENAHTKLDYKCPSHPNLKLSMSLSNLKAGKRCKCCRNDEASAKNKTPIGEIKKLFEGRGYELLDIFYKGSGKLKFRCPKHPKKLNSITLAHLKNGKGCPYCSRVKVDYEDVEKIFEGRNCELIESEYINDKKKMRYKCLIHPEKILQITYDKFRSGQRGCNQCSGRFFATYLEVKQAFEDRGYQLLETEYHGVDVKMKYQCPKHPDKNLSMTYTKLRKGRVCLYCYNPYYIGEGDVKWKGGVSSLNDVLRLQVKAWKMQVLREYGFKCAITGKNGSFHIHHASKPFYHIRDEVLRELGIKKKKLRNEFSEEEVEKITEKFIEMHQSIVGVPMLPSVHKLFHKIYGYDTVISDVWDFRSKYIANEFHELKKLPHS